MIGAFVDFSERLSAHVARVAPITLNNLRWSSALSASPNTTQAPPQVKSSVSDWCRRRFTKTVTVKFQMAYVVHSAQAWTMIFNASAIARSPFLALVGNARHIQLVIDAGHV